MSHFKYHVFFCCNQREAGETCCNNHGATDIRGYAKDRVKALKFPAYTEKIDVSNGVVVRVRAGPYDSKQAAETARAKLAQAGFEAKVVTLQ